MEKKYKISHVIFFSIFLLLTSSLVNSLGKIEASRIYCEENMEHLTNLSNGNYYMVFHDDPFPNACCAEIGTRSYQRDQGTLTFFLFGSKGHYTTTNCDWIKGAQWGEKDYPDFTKPSFFESIGHTIDYYKSLT